MLSPEDLRRLSNLLRHNEQPVWRSNEDVARCFLKIDALLGEQRPVNNQTKMTLYINELIITLMEMLERQHIPLNTHLSTTQRMVEMFLDGLPKHLDVEWTLDSMAYECGLSRSQFSKYCKQITNMTPKEYLNSCRVEIAAQMLAENNDLSITDVAIACGFNSSQYFATVFHKFRGYSPSELRDGLVRLAAN